jgi:hypothetical protein
LEWKSLLRHVAHAPSYLWERWETFKSAARSLSAAQE